MKIEIEKISKSIPVIKQLIADCYPNYKGRTISLSTSVPRRIDSYWDGGSRRYYVFYHVASRKIINVHSNHPAFEPNQPREFDKLPPGVVLVRHYIFCGKDVGITIFVEPEEIFNISQLKAIPEICNIPAPALPETIPAITGEIV